ncbi:acetyl-CoA carboxylase biotin carboxyl carrier protein subunit [Sphingopyxis kveilinensis]|uniref:acetyl-CoA carboxylase biotin carboxyl carrier protein subunit n=1 Tax=Sphingopyxis kveilinensis TaxID=3114367 RepID=UPI0030D2711D
MAHRLFLEGEAHHVWLTRCAGTEHLLLGGAEHPLGSEPGATIAIDGDEVHIHLDGRAYRIRYEHPLDRFAAEARGDADDVACAPMPGVVVALYVAAGDAVGEGDALMVIESMKLETVIRAVRDGVVERVHYDVGRSFDRDAPLVTLAVRED